MNYLLRKVTMRLMGQLRKLLRLSPAGRSVTVLPEDTFLVSYPRSGNTWARFLIGNIISGSQVDFVSVEDTMPSIYISTDRELLLQRARPRILKSHEPYDSRYPKVLYLVRDGRNVAVSFYYYLLKSMQIKPMSFQDFLPLFCRGEITSGYLSWGENVSSWITNAEKVPNGFLLVRYEDLWESTPEEMKKILAFLEIKRTEKEIFDAVKLCSIANMRRLEKEGEDKVSYLKSTDKSLRFVRSGGTQGWKEIMTDQDKKLFNEYYGDLIISLGYESDCSW